ncbi:MAG: Ger(x)C family spore germination C-terminal domain-containing protein [Clostridia bacterium]
MINKNNVELKSKNKYKYKYKELKKPFIFKKTSIAIIVIIVIFQMIGLKSSGKIEHATFANAIGIDISPTSPDKVMVTFQIIPPQISTQTTSSEQEKFIVTSINTDSLEKAIALTHNYMSTVINFSHTRAVIFSEEIAKEKGIEKYINSISSNPTFDTNMFVLISKTKAQKFLESFSQTTEVNPMLYFNILRNSQYISSSTKPVTVMEFSKNLYDPYMDATASVCDVIENTAKKTSKTDLEKSSANTKEKKEDNSSTIDNTKGSNLDNLQKKSASKIEVGGMAVFKGGKLVGILDSDMVACHLMINSKIKGYFLQINSQNKTGDKNSSNTDKENEIANIYLWQQSNSKIDLDINGNIPKIDITIPLNVKILDTNNNIYDFTDKDYMNKMRECINNKLKSDMDNYINIVQKKYDVNIDNYVSYIRKDFLTCTNLNEYNFESKYPTANIHVSFKLKYMSTGLTTKE